MLVDLVTCLLGKKDEATFLKLTSRSSFFFRACTLSISLSNWSIWTFKSSIECWRENDIICFQKRLQRKPDIRVAKTVLITIRNKWNTEFSFAMFYRYFPTWSLYVCDKIMRANPHWNLQTVASLNRHQLASHVNRPISNWNRLPQSLHI